MGAIQTVTSGGGGSLYSLLSAVRSSEAAVSSSLLQLRRSGFGFGRLVGADEDGPTDRIVFRASCFSGARGNGGAGC